MKYGAEGGISLVAKQNTRKHQFVNLSVLGYRKIKVWPFSAALGFSNLATFNVLSLFVLILLGLK